MNSNYSFQINIVFDNKCVEEGFLPGFGFSALIYNFSSEKYILFDTGGNSRTLLHNINKFNVKISSIKKVVISHNHGDHAGGLEGIYKLNPNIEIYVPIANLASYRKVFFESQVHGVSELTIIGKNIYSSGQFGEYYTKEQALFLRTKNNEIIIIVGCSHPGLENFILEAQKLGKIIAIFGGFHGFNKLSYLKDIDLIGACHCTQHIKSIREQYPNQYQRICVGNSFLF
jgi:7,8-dihydropterin-6-yl-methyl-4-(beta-D-ribofuranosyl)aminobenzene 5'-phosphate synthase